MQVRRLDKKREPSWCPYVRLMEVFARHSKKLSQKAPINEHPNNGYETRRIYNKRPMRWLKKLRRQKPQRLTVPSVRFLGEQDGVSERRLKERFVELFRKQATVEHAYLALADHSDGKRAQSL